MAICIDGIAFFVLEEASASFCYGHNHVHSWNLQTWVGGWRAVALHVVQPWRWALIIDSKRGPQSWTHSSRSKIVFYDLVFFAFVVHVSKAAKFAFLLVFEKGIVKGLVININFAHFWLHTLTHLLLQCFRSVHRGCLVPQFCDPGLFNERGQSEWDFVNASFILQISPFLRPVSRHWH